LGLIKYKGDNPLKINQIIDTAQRHFALYGFDKTTMRGIAVDLKVSKGSLYYYFPDKEHLYKAIVLKENDTFILTIQNEIRLSKNPVEALKKYVKIRMDLFHTLINLNRSRLESLAGISSFMKTTNAGLRKEEKEIIKGIFMDGMKAGIFVIKDIDELADLFLELLKGLRMSILREMTFYYLETEEYALLVKRTMQFVEIFTNGIKNEICNL
jgi:AcrR family transcriptional regulator